MAERKKLAIIDGKSVFYRGYYALPNLSTAQGVPTGGVYGFAAMALELIKRLKPDYVAVAWDKPKTNIRKRKELYPEYKAGRKPAPPDFYAQIPLLHELLDAFGWPLYELDDYEADDIMGALAVQARKKDIETMLITSDLDMLQLINGHVHVYALKKGLTNIELFHSESFEKKYGIKPDQFLDLKSLKGDSSDNVPGVPGIGEKTALELLKSYKTLDEVYEHLADIKDSVRAKLEAGKKSAYLSKKLLEIWCDAPIKLDLKAVDGSKINTARVAQLLQKLEFRSLLRNLPGHMQNQVPSADKIAGASLKLPENVLIASDKDLKNLKLEKFYPVRSKNAKNSANSPDMNQTSNGTGKLFVHSRAAGIHGANPQVLIIGSESQIYTLDLTKLNSSVVKKALSPILGKLIGYDVKSDIKLLTNLGVTGLEVKHDVLVGAFLLNSLLRVQSMTELATINLKYEGESFEDSPTEDFIARAPEVMAVIRELYHGQIQALEEVPEIQKLAANTEWPLIPVLANMELAGIKLDVDYLKKFAKHIDGTISDLEQQIYGHADHEFNISSPAQLADVLFAKLNLPTQGVKKGKTGYSTAASELEKLRGLHPVIDLISQYREATKLKNTYVDTLPLLVDKNSRVHTTFNLTIAQTGRLSSTEPNLQNIPIRTELGKNIRTAFVADKGNMLVSADYSQFELRLAAALSGDRDMIDAFNRDADIHVETAAAIYNIKPQEVTKTQRSSVKAVNFGIMYGLGPHALSQSTSMSFGEARDFIKRYFEIRPKLKEYIDSLREKADKQGYVETLLGRRRPTPDVRSSNFAVREAAYRAAVNMPMQGTAADIMKMAMVEVAKKLPAGAKMLLQIHDSLIVECPSDKAKETSKILKETMEGIYKLPVKLKADISIGKNWGEL